MVPYPQTLLLFEIINHAAIYRIYHAFEVTNHTMIYLNNSLLFEVTNHADFCLKDPTNFWVNESYRNLPKEPIIFEVTNHADICLNNLIILWGNESCV